MYSVNLIMYIKVQKHPRNEISHFSSIIHAAGYCKRMRPSIIQSKNYLRKEKKASKTVLELINEENVAEQFASITHHLNHNE